MRGGRDEAAVREYCGRRGFDVVAVVPFDEGVTEADRLGRGLIDHAPEGPAVAALRTLAGELAGRLGLPAPAGA